MCRLPLPNCSNDPAGSYQPIAGQRARSRRCAPNRCVHIADRRQPNPSAAAATLGGARSHRLRADAQGRRAGRRHHHLPPGSPALHRQADRAGAELRRAGRDRHREHAAAQRTAPAHRDLRVAAAADRHRRRAQGHQPLDLRSAGRARYAGRVSGATVRRRHGVDHPTTKGDVLSARRGLRLSARVSSEFMEATSARARPRQRSSDAPCSKARPSISPTSWPIRNTHGRRARRRSAATAPCSACRCCARACRSACMVLTRADGAAIHRQADRAGHDLRRPGGDRDRERAAVRRNPGQEPAARRGEPAQVAVPRQHEPRAAHAAQRHPRLHRADPGRHLRRAAGQDARRARARSEQRQAPARPDQRRARPVQDRGRPAHARPRRLLAQGCRADRLQRGRAAGGDKSSSP